MDSTTARSVPCRVMTCGPLPCASSITSLSRVLACCTCQRAINTSARSNQNYSRSSLNLSIEPCANGETGRSQTAPPQGSQLVRQVTGRSHELATGKKDTWQYDSEEKAGKSTSERQTVHGFAVTTGAKQKRKRRKRCLNQALSSVRR